MSRKRYYKIGKHHCLLRQEQLNRLLENSRFSRLIINNYKQALYEATKELNATKAELEKVKKENTSYSNDEFVKEPDKTGKIIYYRVVNGKKYRISRSVYEKNK